MRAKTCTISALLHALVVLALLVSSCGGGNTSAGGAEKNMSQAPKVSTPTRLPSDSGTVGTPTPSPTKVVSQEPPSNGGANTGGSDLEVGSSDDAGNSNGEIGNGSGQPIKDPVQTGSNSVVGKGSSDSGSGEETSLEKPYRPTKPKLQIPKPGPEYKIQLKIEGYTTYVFAIRNGVRRVVFTEPARYLPGMFEKYIRLSPDNRTLTYAVSVKSHSPRMKMYTIGVDGRNRRLIGDFPWQLWVASPVWSPDSKQIAYVVASGPGQEPGIELWVMNADGSNKHRVVKDPSFNTSLFYGNVQNPIRWTPYGDLQYLDYNSGKIWTVDTTTGELSYQTADMKAPQSDIPLIKSKYPIPIQSQNDPRWRFDIIRTCSDTMGNSGCAITVVSMSFNAYGIKTDPRKLNKDLGRNACPIYWTWASKYFSEGKLELWGVWAFDWYSLDLALSMGRPAMVWLSDGLTLDTSLLSHWVLVVGGSGHTPDGYRIYDPWDGTTYKTLAYYTSKGYGLTRVYVYAPKQPKKLKTERSKNSSSGEQRHDKDSKRD